MDRIKRFFLKRDGKKKVLNKKSVGIFLGVLLFLGILVLLIKVLNEDTSVAEHSDQGATRNVGAKESDHQKPSDPKVERLLENSEKNSKNRRYSTSQRRSSYNYRYKAKQVLNRNDGDNSYKSLPIGTNMIGKLLTSIDTRETDQLYKVILPYGGKFKNGGEISKGSILFGKIRYSGKGDKVFMKFEKGIYPNGKEFEIHAQALNSGDYSPGILGDFHGKAGSRIAATLGLSMVSGMTDVLTEKTELGKAGAVAPKANMKNAMFAGVSKVTELEASRQAQKLSQEEEYVTIDAGKDLIVNLTAGFNSN